ncbi:MAG: adenosylmethionine decarboxylase [Methanocellales archaeon]
MGIHIVVEFLGVDPEKLSRVENVKRILERVLINSKLNVVANVFHQFSPHGVSGVFLLRESHLSIHTWPEYEYAAIDIFTCGREEDALEALYLLIKEFQPKEVKKEIIRREVSWKK